VAEIEAINIANGLNHPTMAKLVKVANIPPAGVNPPYIKDWKAAARDPVKIRSINSGRVVSQGWRSDYSGTILLTCNNTSRFKPKRKNHCDHNGKSNPPSKDHS
jgi:hypothetical protein